MAKGSTDGIEAEDAEANVSVSTSDEQGAKGEKSQLEGPLTGPASQTKDNTTSYGTRSRNRGGSARINYAEVEVDFELHAPVKAARNPDAHPTNTTNSATQASSSRRGQVSQAVDLSSAVSGVTKDIPGTSSFSVTNTPAQAIKKQTRKSAQPAVATPALKASYPPEPRQSGFSTQVMNGLRESAMLSFDDYGSRLKDGKLIADDGTVLSVNGIFIKHFKILHTDQRPRSCLPCMRAAW